MKINTNAPAYPVDEVNFNQNGIMVEEQNGITIRLQIAAMALQGMLAHSTRYKPRKGASNNWHEAISEEAIQLADSLIAELNRTEADNGTNGN